MAALYLADRRVFDLAVLIAKVDFFAMGGGFASVPLCTTRWSSCAAG